MTNFISSGDNVTLAAPYDVLSGAGFLIGSLFAVAAYDAVSGATVEGVREGIFDLTKDTSVFSVGSLVYWDNSAKKVTSVDSGHKLIGVATVAALTGDATARVVLNEAAVG